MKNNIGIIQPWPAQVRVMRGTPPPSFAAESGTPVSGRPAREAKSLGLKILSGETIPTGGDFVFANISQR